VLGTGRPGAPPSLQRCCNEDRWRSTDVQRGVGKLAGGTAERVQVAVARRADGSAMFSWWSSTSCQKWFPEKSVHGGRPKAMGSIAAVSAPGRLAISLAVSRQVRSLRTR